ncbi:amphi-Trp domain-containing protein [Halomarina pelagica]|uniref:amphi-Trp domain-containing protein n=1 Tax=Halomarina pelagica TaxID=2961599 RepID=UPI0020C34176|nr:amphi-Trp domain-containing protein [Halomarina sp. BND7]
MTDTTSFEEEMTREELASYLHGIADEFARGEGEEATIQVGNKRVTLQPGNEVACGVSVKERSALIRKGRQEMTITMNWRT